MIRDLRETVEKSVKILDQIGKKYVIWVNPDTSLNICPSGSFIVEVDNHMYASVVFAVDSEDEGYTEMINSLNGLLDRVESEEGR